MSLNQTYKQNRIDFLTAAVKAEATLTALVHPLDENLTTDIASLGDRDAAHVVVVSSGLHGVELPAGSLFQRLGLQQAQNHRPENVRIVFVHALNPYGSEYALRTDRAPDGGRNIDPARNFIRFSEAGPGLPEADPAIRAAFEKADLSSSSLAMMWAKLLYTAFVEQGQGTFKRNFVRGQYSASGLPYFGGHSASYTRLTWEKIVRETIIHDKLETITHIDVHSGDGPFGWLQLYLPHDAPADSESLAKKLVPEDRIRRTDSYFAKVTGDIGDYWDEFGFPPSVTVHPVTVEFGTTQARIPGIDVLGAILNRTLLSEKYNDDHPKKDLIITQMREAFAPSREEWSGDILGQSLNFWGNMLVHIKSGRISG